MLRRFVIAMACCALMPGTAVFAQTADAGKVGIGGYDAAVAASRQSMMSQPEIALKHAELAEMEASSLHGAKDRETAAITSLWLQSEALSRMQRPDDARPKIEAALKRIVAYDPGSKLHGDVLKTRASIESNGGDVNLALADLHKAHNIFRDLGEPRGQAIALQNLGMIYWRARDYGRVLNYYSQSNEVYPDDLALAMSSNNNRGNAYKEMGNYAAAEAAYAESLHVVKDLNSPTLQARILTNVASAQFMQGKLSEAEATANTGLKLSDGAGEVWQPFLWGVKAQVAHARGDLKSARTLIERAFRGTDLETTQWIYRDFHDAARHIYEALGEHEKAYRHLTAFGRLEQETMEAASSTNAVLLAAKFDAANQELRITKLEADQLRNDRQLQNSEARIQLMTVGGVIATCAVVLILSVLGYAFMAVRRSHREVSSANNQLTHAAEHDALTGLANRPSFRTLLRRSLDGQMSGKGHCALFLIDLDRFKEVNDTLGHGAGDLLLCGVAERLQRLTGEGDHVCRLGGDEFAIVVSSTSDPETLTGRADRMIAEICRPFELEEGRATVGATIGIALGGDHGTSIDDLSRSADLALYSAKEAGRGRQMFYEPAMREAADDRRRLERDLNEALARGQLKVLYQPIVNAQSHEIEAYEALLRWDHPDRGPISPEVFVPIAEDAGLINRIGSWVLRTACETAMSWPPHVKLAVNLSALQVESDGLASTVLSALSASGLAAGRLELEVTETVFLRHGNKTNDMLARLRSVGVSLALDDFGTGYSSLGYLHRAEFAKIKIDRSFVRAAADGWDEGVAVIEAIVSLATSLGMVTTAEGIETEAERASMVKLGCKQLQGYFFGKPQEFLRADEPDGIRLIGGREAAA
ncbi:MAG: EAL domain-containing protein [Pacificimonas sp.]